MVDIWFFDPINAKFDPIKDPITAQGGNKNRTYKKIN